MQSETGPYEMIHVNRVKLSRIPTSSGAIVTAKNPNKHAHIVTAPESTLSTCDAPQGSK